MDIILGFLALPLLQKVQATTLSSGVKYTGMG